MKICYIAKFKKRGNEPIRNASLVANGLRSVGVQVDEVEYPCPKPGRMLSKIQRRGYDCIIMSKCPGITKSMVRSLRIPFFVLIADSISHRLKKAKQRGWIARATRALCLFTPAFSDIPIYNKMGVKAEVHHQGCDTARFTDYGLKKEVDVCFVGDCYGKPSFRRQTMKRVLQGLPNVKTVIRGRGWGGLKHGGPIFGQQLGQLYNRSRIVLCMNEREKYDNYFSNRLWSAMGCKTVVLHKWLPGLADIFQDGRDLITWRSENFLSIIKQVLDDQEKQQRISERGFSLITSNHAYHHRAKELVRRMRNYM